MPPLSEKTGIILVNLGSPEEPTEKAARHYLKEFLSDRRIVPLPRLLWWFILHALILRTRPALTAEKYKAIWTKEGSPLIVHSQRQASLLRGFLGTSGQRPEILIAMRYGKPSIQEALTQLRKKACSAILVLPLYPQYSLSTTASIMDVVKKHTQSWKSHPQVKVIRHFHDFPPYIAALEQSVREYWRSSGIPGDSYKLLISFHGLPQKSIERGDPYYSECLETGKLLAKRLNLQAESWTLCFQSRFGKGKWLMPSTEETLKTLAQQGVKRIDVICPGFVSDCLETLEEIAIQGKKTHMQNGGNEFNFIACLNEREDWIHALLELVQKESAAPD